MLIAKIQTDHSVLLEFTPKKDEYYYGEKAMSASQFNTICCDYSQLSSYHGWEKLDPIGWITPTSLNGEKL